MMNQPYPLFLQPGKLSELNECAAAKLGFPLFFCSTERSRPVTGEAVGELYEVITGLYVIYHDYGTRILKNFREFCEKQNCKTALRDGYEEECSRDKAHQRAVSILRTGFCHGIFPNTQDGEIYVETLRNLAGIVDEREESTWPEFSAGLNQAQCSQVLKGLTRGSDELYNHLLLDINAIAARQGMPRQYRSQLRFSLLNGRQEKWGQEGYFDHRIVKQVRGYSPKTLAIPEKMVVSLWLQNMETDILEGKIKNCDEPLRRLRNTYEQARNGTLQLKPESPKDTEKQTVGAAASSLTLGKDLQI